MFVDYLTVMIVNLVAGLALLAVHVVFFMENDPKRLAPGFLVTGFISTVTGLHLTLTWPLPGANNIPIGEMSLLFGVLFLVAGLALIGLSLPRGRRSAEHYAGWDRLVL